MTPINQGITSSPGRGTPESQVVGRRSQGKDGRLLLRVTKNATPRTAWLHAEAKRLLTAHAKVRRLGDSSVFLSPTGRRYGYQKPFAGACEAAGMDDFRFHDLRHSAATYLAREGATEQQLRAIGGWKSNVVSRYVHLAAEGRQGHSRQNEREDPREVTREAPRSSTNRLSMAFQVHQDA